MCSQLGPAVPPGSVLPRSDAVRIHTASNIACPGLFPTKGEPGIMQKAPLALRGRGNPFLSPKGFNLIVPASSACGLTANTAQRFGSLASLECKTSPTETFFSCKTNTLSVTRNIFLKARTKGEVSADKGTKGLVLWGTFSDADRNLFAPGVVFILSFYSFQKYISSDCNFHQQFKTSSLFFFFLMEITRLLKILLPKKPPSFTKNV